MKVKSKKQFTSDVPEIEPGTYDARLLAVISRGVHPTATEKFPDKKPSNNMAMIFELVDEQIAYKKKNADGELEEVLGNRIVRKYGALSTKPNSFFRKAVEAILVGAPELRAEVIKVDKDDEEEIDIEKLIGLPCMVSIIRNDYDKSVLDNVVGLSPKKVDKVTEGELKPFIFDPYSKDYMAVGREADFHKGMAAKILTALDLEDFAPEAVEFLEACAEAKSAKKPAPAAAPAKPKVTKKAAPVVVEEEDEEEVEEKPAPKAKAKVAAKEEAPAKPTVKKAAKPAPVVEDDFNEEEGDDLPW